MLLHYNRKRDDKGFTLIELLVVMIIIGILAAIAVPIYLNQQKSARDTQTVSDVRGVYAALTQGLIKCNNNARVALTDADMNAYAGTYSMADSTKDVWAVTYEGTWLGKDSACLSASKVQLSQGTHIMASYSSAEGAIAVYGWNRGGKQYAGGDYTTSSEVPLAFNDGDVYRIRSSPQAPPPPIED